MAEESINERVRKARISAGFRTGKDAAEALGIVVSTYLGYENGDRKPGRSNLQTIARRFRVSLDWLITGKGSVRIAQPNFVPVVGYVGAGFEAHFYDNDQGTLDEAPLPPDGGPSTVAMIVRGDSMVGIADDGALVYFDDSREPVTDDLIGRLCVVGTTDGRTLVKKILRRGREPGTFDLVSASAAPMFDVPVAWAAAVTWVKPR